MREKNFSIITPSYNSFSLMNKYFETLERQTYKNFEIIIVDDCSTDDSYSKIEEYKNNSNLDIKILKNKKNNGPGECRNYGIKEAKGKWVTFIDSDDYVDENLLERVNEIVTESDIDCVVYDYYIKKDNVLHYSNSIYGNGKSGIMNTRETISKIRNHAACKFYKLEILKKNNIYFPDIRKHEDVAFVPITISYCKKIYYLKEALYYYVQREKSVSNDNVQNNTLLLAFEILKERLGREYEKEIKEKSITDLLYGSCFIMCKNKKNKSEIIEFIKKYEKDFYLEWAKSKLIGQLNYSKRLFLFAIRYRCITFMKIYTYIHSKVLN